MENPITQGYITTNAEIIRTYNKYRDQGDTTRVASIKVGIDMKCSKDKVKSLIYKKNYPYAAEAREIVNKERAATTNIQPTK